MCEKDKNEVSFVIQISVALLVMGSLIGAGILGIPIIAGVCGLVPALLGMVLYCVAMFYSACVLAEETMVEKCEVFNYPSLYHKYLGNVGKWLAVVTNMLILYGLLTAYLAGGTTIVVQVFRLENSKVVCVILFVLMSGIVVGGMKLIQRCNAILVALLWGSFVTIVVMGIMHLNVSHFEHAYWIFLPVALPVIVTSFLFHNLIPNVTKALKWQRKPVKRVILAGLVTGLVMNLIWLLVGIGVLPLTEGLNSIVQCYQANIPATVPMAKLIGSKYFMVFALLFSAVAIVTSYVAQGLGLLDFTHDMIVNHIKINSRMLVFVVTFVPPLICSLVDPNIFIKAVNLVGGYGIVILFGILPCTMAMIKKSNTTFQRITGFFFLLIFAFVLLSQIVISVKWLQIPLPK